jgi:hypothetical protein
METTLDGTKSREYYVVTEKPNQVAEENNETLPYNYLLWYSTTGKGVSPISECDVA